MNKRVPTTSRMSTNCLPFTSEKIVVTSRFFTKCFSVSILFRIFAIAKALVAKLVDALDLGSSGLCRVGSSPIRRTKKR